jgi:hypothetical protein
MNVAYSKEEDTKSSNRFRNKLDEYNRINETVAAIIAAENKIKNEMLEKQLKIEAEQHQQQQLNAAIKDFYHDQSKYRRSN